MPARNPGQSESSGGGEPRPYEKNISRYAQLFTTLCIIKAECARERARKAESDYETGEHLYQNGLDFLEGTAFPHG